MIKKINRYFSIKINLSHDYYDYRLEKEFNYHYKNTD